MAADDEASRRRRHRLIEQRSLRIGVVASAVMAVGGLWVHVLSGSYALLLDGLYSAVMVGSGLVAARISRNVVRPPDRAYPYGYDGQEALYVLFRSLVLIGVLTFAAAAGLGTVIDYAKGQQIPAVSLGPVALYSIAMVVICWGLAWCHHRDWRRTGEQSQLLITEARAAKVDGLISGLTGMALLSTPLLQGTALAVITPITDSLLVLVVSGVVLREPLQAFLTALNQAAGASAESDTIRSTRAALEDLLSGLSCWLLDLTVMQVGRTAFVVVYLNPSQPMDGAAIDLIRLRIEERCRQLMASPVRSEVILTATPPFPAG
ncbi:MAG: cation efflux family transporter [Synechococcus sp. TMED187]|jgi:predicted Co/Zn/Cd cation transporter (cation efflux family)|nr:cation efflux family transporter [Synechococcus sp. NAT40]OUW48840.1 MAG: cation efflux family transporter [Synechococcus sp. TMED187]RZO14825.1 MAG: cation transporter [Synechococcus sp. MED-G135]|tara:strand:+ start:940 stop:1899 length:960 start_codon:yes stop_codon:yes gene_type:complete